FPRIVLMLGNVVVGMTILGPAGMLAELATGLGVGIHDTGLLVTYGAVVLCIGSPVMAWLTTRIDRRVLLVVTLAVLAIGQAVSALTSSYFVILLLRIIMLNRRALYAAGSDDRRLARSRPRAAKRDRLRVSRLVDRDRGRTAPFNLCRHKFRLAGRLRRSGRFRCNHRDAVVCGVAEGT